MFKNFPRNIKNFVSCLTYLVCTWVYITRVISGIIYNYSVYEIFPFCLLTYFRISKEEIVSNLSEKVMTYVSFPSFSTPSLLFRKSWGRIHSNHNMVWCSNTFTFLIVTIHGVFTINYNNIVRPEYYGTPKNLLSLYDYFSPTYKSLYVIFETLTLRGVQEE